MPDLTITTVWPVTQLFMSNFDQVIILFVGVGLGAMGLRELIKAFRG